MTVAAMLKFKGPDVREIADFHSWKQAEIDRLAWADPAKRPKAGEVSEDVALAEARSEEAFALYGWRPYMHDPGLGRWLERLALPALVLWGEQDGIVAPDYGEAYAALPPRGRFETIAGAGHYPTREQPQATAARVVEFEKSL